MSIDESCVQISFNGGAQWRDLQAPASYRYPSCNKCQPGDVNCQLHLHGPSSWVSGPGASKPLENGQCF